MPGVGLLDQWYDACMGLYPTPQRMNAFNFSVPFTENIRAALHYRLDSNPDDPDNVTGKKIGFVEGWVISAQCLNRKAGVTAHDYTAIYYDSHNEMIDALKRGEVDAALSADVFEAEKLGVK